MPPPSWHEMRRRVRGWPGPRAGPAGPGFMPGPGRDPRARDARQYMRRTRAANPQGPAPQFITWVGAALAQSGAHDGHSYT